MKVIATICAMQEGNQVKLISIDPNSKYFFVNRDDLQGEIEQLAIATEQEGKVGVIGMLMGPDE